MTETLENKTIDIHPKYANLSANVRYHIVSGGRNSGKSYSVASFLAALTFESGHVIYFCRKTKTGAATSIVPEFLGKIEEMGLIHLFHITRDEITNKQSGSKIIFKGLTSNTLQNTALVKGWTDATTFVLDEAEELNDEKMFDAINLSVRSKKRQNRIILIFNPTTKEHFIYQKFYALRGINGDHNGIEKNVNYVHTTYLDNIDNIAADYLNEIAWIKINQPNKYKHVILGSWREKAEGVIFTNWKLGDYQEIGNTYHGLDFGWTHPTAMIQCNVDKTNKRIYAKELIYEQGLRNTPLINRIKPLCPDYELITADSADPKTIETIRLEGQLNIVEAKKGPDSIRAGINLLWDYEIIVDPRSHNLIKELNNYVWDDKKSQTPIDAYNHLIDALRYATERLKLTEVFVV